MEISEIKPFDNVENRWEINIESAFGNHCPCKNDYCNQNHNPTLYINPKLIWMRCFRNGGLCNENAFQMDLPQEKVQEFFPGYGNTFFSKYGVNTEDVRPHRNFLSIDSFMRIRRNTFIAINCMSKTLMAFMRSEYSLSKIVGDYMEDFVKIVG